MRKYVEIPTICPNCKSELEQRESKNGNRRIITLHCVNPQCPAKLINHITHFCSRGCMDIQGISEATVEFLVNANFIKNIHDLYMLVKEYDETGTVTNMDAAIAELRMCEGWRETSVKNMIDAIKSSKQTTFVKFLPALSIPMVGKGQAKMLAPEIIAWEESHSKGKSLFHSLVKMVESGFDFTSINGFGDVLAANLVSFIEDKFLAPACMNETTPEMRVLGELTFVDTKEDYVKEYNSDSGVAGKTFVITGSVNHYANRDALKAEIESLGGKVSGSVSKNTDYLINNDTESTSGKNKKAKELGVAIISEDDYRTLAGV